jgi:hypothetical protein
MNIHDNVTIEVNEKLIEGTIINKWVARNGENWYAIQYPSSFGIDFITSFSEKELKYMKSRSEHEIQHKEDTF